MFCMCCYHPVVKYFNTFLSSKFTNIPSVNKNETKNEPAPLFINFPEEIQKFCPPGGALEMMVYCGTARLMFLALNITSLMDSAPSLSFTSSNCPAFNFSISC